MTYDKMAVLLALIAAQLNSRELKATVAIYRATRRAYARARLVYSQVELKDAYEENRR